MKIYRPLCVLVCFLAVSAMLRAGEIYQFDPAHSTIGFKIRHLFSDVTGRFNEFSGMVNIDPEKPENSVVDVTIQTKSIDTANTKRDDHLRSPDFFDAATKPTITFKSKKVVLTGEKTATVTGDLTMNGVTKELPLTVKFLGKGKGMDGNDVTGWSATAELDRTDYGLKWSKIIEGTKVVDDKVIVEIQVEANAKK